jgi:hypothetical protein
LANTLKIKNKGGYTAKATLTYSLNKRDYIDTRTILSAQSYKFQYNKDSINIIIRVEASAYKGYVFAELVKDQVVCYDIYGALPNPKYTRVNC